MGEISSIVQSPVAAEKPAVSQASDAAKEKKLRKACADFEALLVFQLLKTMRQSVQRTGFLKPSQGQETYEMMLDQKIAEDLAGKGGGLGLQKMLYNQMMERNPKKD
jgi:flagellar protein FlgJ